MSDESKLEERYKKFSTIYYNELGMCGCGRPEDVRTFILKLLKLNIERWENKGVAGYGEKFKQVFNETDSDVLFEFVFHVFDNVDLLDHGGSIYGAWTTEKGREFVSMLEDDVVSYED